MKKFYTLAALILSVTAYSQTYHNLSGGPFTQNWANTGLLGINNDWSGVPSIQGYRGDDLTTVAGTDPQTIVGDGFTTPLNVTVNQSTPNTVTSGGIFEFEITDPVVAFQGSGTSDAPFLVIFLNTTGVSNIRIRYNLRDIDGSADDAVQPVALQYRIGTTGNFINVPAGFVADASTGPSLATLVTAVNVLLPSACDNQAQVQIRIITANAFGTDEFIGVDDIDIRQDATASVNNIIRNPNYVRIAGNPGSDLNIQFNQSVSSDVHLQFFSANGEMVLQKRLGRISEGQVEKISLSHLPKGLYMLSIRSKDGTFTTKVIN